MRTFRVEASASYMRRADWESRSEALERWVSGAEWRGLMTEESLPPNEYPRARYSIEAQGREDARAEACARLRAEMHAIGAGDPDDLTGEVLG